MFRRIVLFLAMNIAVIALISILLSVFNVSPYLTPYGLNYQSLLIYAAVIGFAGSAISLLSSKWMAKMTFKIQMIETPQGAREIRVHSLVQKHAHSQGIKMPQLGIYHSPDPNAFATGPSRNNSLVAFSTGLIDAMNEDELEGVVAHEIAHVANGDMVTMALMQGVLNTFVIFAARVAGYAITMFTRDEDGNSAFGTLGYYMISIILEIVFGIFASIILMAYSRHREFRADAGSAKTAGAHKMIASLERLKRLSEAPLDDRSKAFATMQINDRRSSMVSLFSSHPSLDDRIEALKG